MSNASPYRAAVIGCGYIGSRVQELAPDNIISHAGAYSAASATDLVGVFDIDPDRSRAAADHWRTQAYPSLEALLAEARPQIVSISSPDNVHAEQAEICLKSEAVAAILLEKPLSKTTDEAEQLIRLAAERRKPLAVNYARRYEPGHRAIARRLAAGDLGRIQHVTGWYTKGIRHNGSHMLDLLSWYFGSVLATEITAVHGQNEDDPCVDAEIEFANGVSAHLHGCDSGAHAIFELDILGTAGRVRLANGGHQIDWQVVGDDPNNPGYRALGPVERQQTGMRDLTLLAVDDMVGVLNGERAAPASGGDNALAALKLAQDLISKASEMAGDKRQERA